VTENSGTSTSLQAAWQSWHDEIRALGVTNPLLSFELNPQTQIDLNRAHPSGISQLIGSGSAVLSNLVREPLSLSRALNTARRVHAKGSELLEHFGLNSLFLTAGLANLEPDGFDLRLPILLRPVALVTNGDDFDVQMLGPAIANPFLIKHFEICYGINLSATTIARRAESASELLPIAVFDYLNQALGEGGKPELSNLLAVGNFVLEPGSLLDDFARTETALLRRIAGQPDSSNLPAREISGEPLLIANADEAQKRVVGRAVAGHSFVVETLPGCGSTQLVANVVAALSAEGRRVLVLAPRQQTLAEVAERFAALGLPGLAVRSRHAWVDVISAISRNEKSQPADYQAALAARSSAEKPLANYFQNLNQKDSLLGVSVVEVFEQLARLSGSAKSPENTARIDSEFLPALKNRERALELLQKAKLLGEFDFGPQDTAWYQARFESPAQVDEALGLAVRLRDEVYPELAEKLSEFITGANLRSANSVAEWGKYLELFIGLRETLDTFVPDVFDRSLTELIQATGSKHPRGEMSGGTRRRLKKLAKEYVRAGINVGDLHAALSRAQAQNEMWQAFAISPTPPQVPAGIREAEQTYRVLVRDLDLIQQHLDPDSGEEALVDLPLQDLKAKLLSLAEKSPALENLGERAGVMAELRGLGLSGLCRELSRLHCAQEHILPELELAWWRSCLEHLLLGSAASIAIDSNALGELETAFASADENVINSAVGHLGSDLAASWKAALVNQSSEAAAIKTLLRAGSATLPELLAAAPNLFWSLTKTVMMSPYEVADLLPKESFGQEFFDVVLLLDCAGSTVAENLAGLVRAKQVIGFGDDAIASADGFEVEARIEPLGREQAVDSAFSVLRKTFDVEVLRRSYRKGGQALGAVINREFYQNRIIFEPAADEFLGRQKATLELVTENNFAEVNGSLESLDSEVSRVAELVFNHALWHPEESLVVATPSVKHANRLGRAIHDGLIARPQFQTFFEAHGREKFAVLTLKELNHRTSDRVIFSVGFGRTQHGEVLADFGQLSESGGRRLLANLLVSARRRITTVSCFSAVDLQKIELPEGALLLRDLLNSSNNKFGGELGSAELLSDLAMRIKKLGIRTEFDLGGRLPLVASFAKSAIAILPDSEVNFAEASYEVRLRPQLLRDLGWQVMRVSSFELFAEPQVIALRVAAALGINMREKPMSLFDESDRAFEDTDLAWGEAPQSNDQRLRDDKPPHWG